MLEILPVTPELLAELGAEFGGCDFTGDSQAGFLRETGSCDVQAAPGHGKTTLLAAKLALLGRNWSNRRQGVCIISHTNAARSEVEDHIARNPTAARLMAYPHFTGTVTAFINQCLALPYLRGLGWSVRQIDDDAFAAAALRRYGSYNALDWLANKAKHGSKQMVEQWVTCLDLDSNFIDTTAEPTSLAVRRRPRQHGPDTPCGKALAHLKASMVRSGLYRYADMTALARRALANTPGLADRLRARFPLVILDEAQDTHGASLELLEQIFKQDGSAFQRLGDSNQTLYEDEEAGIYWTPAADCVPLDTSRRFGNEIADFASRLTARKAQVIVGTEGLASSRVLFLFDQATIGNVLGAFAEEARVHWGKASGDQDLWAVASRHNIPGRKKGAWEPKSLVDYYPAYRSEAGAREKALLFCHHMQRASVYHTAGRAPAEVADMLALGIAGFARAHRWQSPAGKPVTPHNVWATLAQRDTALPRVVRRVVYDHVLYGDAAWNEPAWSAFVDALLPHFAPVPEIALRDLVDFVEFVVAQKADPADPERHATRQARFNDITLRLGSIHSVKGRSVDGILLVESEVWKGQAKDQRCIDLTTVLPHAFGVRTEAFTGVQSVAATNIFVGVTRARELLGLAIRKASAASLLDAAVAQGWKIVDLGAIEPTGD